MNPGGSTYGSFFLKFTLSILLIGELYIIIVCFCFCSLNFSRITLVFDLQLSQKNFVRGNFFLRTTATINTSFFIV